MADSFRILVVWYVGELLEKCSTTKIVVRMEMGTKGGHQRFVGRVLDPVGQGVRLWYGERKVDDDC